MAQASGRENRLVVHQVGAHQERILIAMKENMAVSIYRPNYKQFIVLCVGKLDILRFFTSIASFMIRVVSLLPFVNFLLCSKGQEESSPN
jgi:hypothetical protein